MTLIDGGILIILALALVVGFFRGIVRLLLAWAFIVAGVVIAFFHPGLAATLAPSPLARPIVGLVIVAVFGFAGGLIARLVAPLVYARIPGLRAADRLGGMALSGVMSLISIYLMLSGLVTVDSLLTPVTSATSVSGAELAEVRALLQQHPELASLVNPEDLAAAQDQVGGGTVSQASLSQLSPILGTWAQIHEQLADSKVAPVIFETFDHLPLVGRDRRWPSP